VAAMQDLHFGNAVPKLHCSVSYYGELSESVGTDKCFQS